LLLIPESRKKPLTESLLYKQIIRFFEEEGIRDRFEIAFITINDGVVDSRNHAKSHAKLRENYPPALFRSGRTWLKKEQIGKMANNIIQYLKANSYKLKALPIAYVRGSYLEVVRLANKKLEPNTYNLNPIQEIFSDDELSQLKKRGIKWMKIGLRMPEAFEIFQKRIRDINKESEDRQFRLF
jgi:hypothetical protein